MQLLVVMVAHLYWGVEVDLTLVLTQGNQGVTMVALELVDLAILLAALALAV
jgi:hypothetical protein